MIRAVAVATAWATLGGCGPPEVELLTGVHDVAGENPLVPEIGLYPWPSDQYLSVDLTRETGRVVDLADAELPDGFLPEMFDQHDGFSRIPAILAWLPGGFDPATLPEPSNPGATTVPGSSVLLIETATGDLIPALVELDLTVDDPVERSLIVRPHQALRGDAGYVVALTTDLTAADGTPHVATEAFRALRDNIPTDSTTVETLRDSYPLVSAALASAELDPANVALAWSFHTRSANQSIRPAVAVQDAMMIADLSTWTLDSDEVDGDNRLVRGTLDVPNFLNEDRRFVFDEEGYPIEQGVRTIDWLVTIPQTVTETRPVIVYGHGFFSSLEEPTWSNLNDGMQQWRMSAITTDFIGFSENDLVPAIAALAGPDFSGFDALIWQQVQSQGHFTALARFVKATLAHEITIEGPDNPIPALDINNVPYMGISNGGTQGLVMMTSSPAFTRGALIVPGVAWSHMLQRAVQWNELGVAVTSRYNDSFDLQLAVSMLQPIFDPVDGINFVDHLINDRLEGRPQHPEILLVEAVGDSQVANLVTEWAVRTAGIPVVSPTPVEVWGVDLVNADPPDGYVGTAAMEVYDECVPANPGGNLAPLQDNGTHDTVRLLPEYREQLDIFLNTGAIVHPCDGACVFCDE